MFGLLSQKKPFEVHVDLHSHLIPGIDDGVKSMEESLEILRFFARMGYRKVITTPHAYAERHPNTTAQIREAFATFYPAISAAGLPLQLECAAEYYLNEHFLESLKKGEKPLTVGDTYVLVETGFYTKPLMTDEVLFCLGQMGYTMILAHPERYAYAAEDPSWLARLKQRGVKMQMNLTSLVGHYGPEVQKTAATLLKKNWIDFLGSDIHHSARLPDLERALRQRIVPQTLLNDLL